MSDKNVIFFPFGAKKSQDASAKKPEEKASPDAELPKLDNLVTPTFNVKKEPLRVLQPYPSKSYPEEIEERLPTFKNPSGDNLRTIAKLSNTPLGNILQVFSTTAIEKGSDFEKKLLRLKEMESALASLRPQMGESRVAANVAMRRGMMREAGREDLINQFWNSTEHNWSAKPSTFIALLDELEERGFFTFTATATIPQKPQP